MPSLSCVEPNKPRQNGERNWKILNNEKVFTVFKASWSPDPLFFLASCASCRERAMDWLNLIERAPGITELLAKS